MKKFIKLERIITEEQLAEIEQAFKKKHPLSFKTVLQQMGTNLCSCGSVSTYQAIFDVGDNMTMVEKYCAKCIDNQCHIKTPQINVFNFDQFFDAIPEYRQVLKQRYEELVNPMG